MTQTGLISTGNAAAVCVASVAKPHCRVRQWELVEFAGLGSLAHIFRARPVGTSADRPANYAVKMLRPCWQDETRRFACCSARPWWAEHVAPALGAHPGRPRARAAAAVGHAWLEGASLAARLADGQQFGVPETLWIARQTAEALDALYAAGWMHGDVTPGNIQVSPTGTSRCWI